MHITEDQLELIVKKAVKSALDEQNDPEGVVVLHEHCPLNSDDVAFFKRLKHSIDTTASWVGHGFILMGLAAVAYVIRLGFEAWRTNGG